MESYPISFSIDYPAKSDRLTVAFRLITVIPIVILLMLLQPSSFENNQMGEDAIRITSLGIVLVPTILMIVFRRKYPKWWYEWNVALTKFSLRVAAYFLLLRDEYPSTDEEQAVHVVIPYPDVKRDLNQWLPLVKWFLAIPHYIVLCLLLVAVVICSIIVWFVIVFTGKYPQGIFRFVEGSMRWALRVGAYAFLLTTDQYPPFRLSE